MKQLHLLLMKAGVRDQDLVPMLRYAEDRYVYIQAMHKKRGQQDRMRTTVDAIHVGIRVRRGLRFREHIRHCFKRITSVVVVQ